MALLGHSNTRSVSEEHVELRRVFIALMAGLATDTSNGRQSANQVHALDIQAYFRSTPLCPFSFHSFDPPRPSFPFLSLITRAASRE
jgi:hypothetical protein